jgi:Ca2+-binding RTX toxin-like protein
MAAKRRRFRFEQLECRKMMTFSGSNGGDEFLDTSNEWIELQGTPGDDVVEVIFSGSQVEIRNMHPNAQGTGLEGTILTRNIADVYKIIFHGGDGNDTMNSYTQTLNAGVSTNGIEFEFYGEGHNDTFDNQSAVPSWAYGGPGDDTLLGGSFNDHFFGDQGNDTLNGRNAHDYYVFAGANLGSDTLAEAAGQGTDYIDLSGLTLTNTWANDSTYLDLASTSQQMVYLAENGQHFRLTLADPQAIDIVYGTGVADYFYGNNQANALFGYAGNDRLEGRGGGDKLAGETGNDVLLGGPGVDQISGGDGHDLMMGDEYSSRVYNAYAKSLSSGGGQIAIATLALQMRYQFGAADLMKLDDAFHSVLEAAEVPTQFGAADILTGGIGNDVLYGGSGGDVMNGQDNDDFLIGGRGDDDLFGDTAQAGSQGADYLFGGSGLDDLFGFSGADWLFGGNDKDTLDGGANNDFLYGRFDGQADTLKGGTGQDTFARYARRDPSGAYIEQPEESEVDFTSNEDLVQVLRF